MPGVNPVIGAIVLAAGPASRMGRPKQLLPLRGQSLVRRAAQAALDGGCAPVIVVTGAHADAVAAELTGLAIVRAFNPDWSRGMGGSIRAGLAALLAAEPLVDAAVVMVCDQPHLDGAVVRNLVGGWSGGGNPMAASEYGGTVGPPCCFGRGAFGSLRSIADSDGAKRLLQANPQSVTRIPWPAGSVDVDTREDWQDVLAKEKERGQIRNSKDE
jgi:molybdenum cofactor cytidylyltransferase